MEIPEYVSNAEYVFFPTSSFMLLEVDTWYQVTTDHAERSKMLQMVVSGFLNDHICNLGYYVMEN